MANLKNSIAKEWYRLTVKRRLAKREWAGDYWYEQDGNRIVACRLCPKFDAAAERCGVPFGTPIRKCVAAATEANLHHTRGMTTLELGYGRRALSRAVIRASGGSWTGLEPSAERRSDLRIGQGGYGHAGDIPFADETFDLVFGIQSFEHWAERHDAIDTPTTHEQCLEEIHRVLKPGGMLYVDAPIHLHGDEMFVMGDVPRIVALFRPDRWRDLVVERWRYDHAPLPRYPAPATDSKHWSRSVVSYDSAALERIRTDSSVWLLTIKAYRREQPA